MDSPKHGLINSDNVVRGERSLPAQIAPAAPRWTEAPTSQQGGGLASYLEIPFMHKRLIIVCTLLGILFAWLAILICPRTYESEAKLMVKVGRESVSLDPTATTGSDLMMLQKTLAEEIGTALELLNSRRIAERAVDAIGVDAVLKGELPKPNKLKDATSSQLSFSKHLESWKAKGSQVFNDALMLAGVKESIGDRERAIRGLQLSLKIKSPKKSSVVVIEGRSASPEMAQAVVGEVTHAFVDEHLSGAHTDGSFEFFQEQAADIEKELSRLVADRAAFMQEHKIVSIEANRELIKDQLTGINRDLVLAYGDLEQAMAESKDLAVKNDQTADEVVAERLEVEASTWSAMRQQIYELELEEQHASARFTEAHPRLKRIRVQLEGARKILAELKGGRFDLNTTPNPMKISIGNQLQLQETTIAGIQSEIKEKEQRAATTQQQIDELLEQERHLLTLDREVRLAETNLQSIREKQEEARILDELHANKFSNIHVFQPATFVERPASPPKRILAVGFLFLGLMTGIALSFVREGCSPAVRTPKDVELRLAAPVVTSIPRLKRMKSPRSKFQRTYRNKCRELMADILMTQHRLGRARGRSIGIIGVDTGAGASTLAINLAMSSDIDCHLKTVLVDADSRNRSVSKTFGLNGSPGLVELLSGTASHDECLQKVQNREIELISTSADANHEILSSPAPEIVQALEAYLQDCDLLIVDLPAASEPDQAVALAQHLDCLLIVAESEKTQLAAADRLLNRLCNSDAQVLGVVLTKTRSYLPGFIRTFVAPQV